jgi:glucose uptake protein
MFIVHSYTLAVILCFITMLCWGSWGNTQKLAAKSWRYELFYWDYVIGMVIFSLLLAFTLGSIGSEGRPFTQDIAQLSWSSVGWILLGAVVFNLSNILLSASTSIAGLSVAFPLGVGLALVIGVFNNYIFHPSGHENVWLLFIGVALIIIALICNGIASGKVDSSVRDKATNRKGIILAILAGIIMSFFSPLVYNGMDLNNFASPEAGKATPYTAMFIFAIGVFLSNFVFNTYVMKKPFVGEPVSYSEYFKGNGKTHLVGMLGGAIWCLGTALNYISAGTAGASISYALGQGAPMIAAIWGVFIWKEFKGAKKGVNALLAIMFVFFIIGLGCIVAAGGN